MIAHSCTASDGSFAIPAFARRNSSASSAATALVLPICADSFAPSLDRIATLINAQLQPPCISSPVAHKANSNEFDCTVVSHTASPNGGAATIDKTVLSCDVSGGAAPCWSLTPGGTCGQGSVTVTVSDDPTLPPSTAQNATVNCALCDPMFPDPSRMCN